MIYAFERAKELIDAFLNSRVGFYIFDFDIKLLDRENAVSNLIRILVFMDKIVK